MRTKFRSIADEVFFFGAFSVLSGGYVELPLRVMAPRMELGKSNPFNAMAMLVILCGLVAFGGAGWRKFLAFARRAWHVNLYVLLAAVSAVWSVDPMITARRSVTLAIGVGFGYYAASRFTMDGVLRRIAAASLGLAASSVFVALLIPRFGVMSDGDLAGRWNGVFPHKQQLGQAMFLGVMVLAWLVPRYRGWGKTGLYAGIAACLGVLMMARSQTSMLSVLAVPPMFLVMAASRVSGIARMWALYAMTVVLAALLAVLTTDLSEIMGFFGRDASLTGRAPLWGLLLGIIADHAATGFGYGAFWIADNPVSMRVNDISGWYVPEAHNGYLDLMLQTGLPGLLLALAMLYGILRDSFAANAERVGWASFAGAFTLIVTISNLAETMLFRTGDVQCMLLPLLCAALLARRAGLETMDAADARGNGGHVSEFETNAALAGMAPIPAGRA